MEVTKMKKTIATMLAVLVLSIAMVSAAATTGDCSTHPSKDVVCAKDVKVGHSAAYWAEFRDLFGSGLRGEALRAKWSYINTL